MPKLNWFWTTSLPDVAVKAAKQLWKGEPGIDLRITKPHKPEWLAQNLDNPFRDWDGAEHIPAASAKKAANQYHKTRSELLRLTAELSEDAQAEALTMVAEYTQTFNKMSFIETVERDKHCRQNSFYAIYFFLCVAQEMSNKADWQSRYQIQDRVLFQKYR